MNSFDTKRTEQPGQADRGHVRHLLTTGSHPKRPVKPAQIHELIGLVKSLDDSACAELIAMMQGRVSEVRNTDSPLMRLTA